MADKEIRAARLYNQAALAELRADETAPLIAGYAAVFDSFADLGFFREIIKPGAFSRALAEGQDVRALVDHNPSMILGRTKASTLRLREDERGLFAEIDAPGTTLGRDTVESLKRGDLDQMSFAFSVGKDIWIEEKGQTPLREIHEIDTLFDVSVVAFPAYEQTSVSVRSKLEEIARRAAEADQPDMGMVNTVRYINTVVRTR